MTRQLITSDYNAFSLLRSLGLKTDPTSFWASDLEELPVRQESFENTLRDTQQFISGFFKENELVGILGFLREDKTKLEHKGSLWGVYIHPGHRGNGYAKSIMNFAIKEAFQLNGLRQINLSVGSHNKAAMTLYLKMGFKIYGEEKNAS
jgi:ribosomal protein S18 acetylase RimI-like enzyme